MGFWITIYKIDKNLPEYLTWKDREMSVSEITPGIYKSVGFKKINCKDLKELKETIEKEEKLEVSDIVEWQVDEDFLNHPCKELAEMLKDETNYFIMKFWGLDSIAIENEKVFIELTQHEIASMIGFN